MHAFHGVNCEECGVWRSFLEPEVCESAGCDKVAGSTVWDWHLRDHIVGCLETDCSMQAQCDGVQSMQLGLPHTSPRSKTLMLGSYLDA